MRVAPVIIIAAVLAACASTPQASYMQAEIALSKAYDATLLALRTEVVTEDQVRRFVRPLLNQAGTELDTIHDQLDAGLEPDVDLVTSVLGLARLVLSELARLEEENA